MTSCDLTKTWVLEQLMIRETSSCRQKQDPTWLEMMVWTAGKYTACRAAHRHHVSSISLRQKRTIISGHEHKSAKVQTTLKGHGRPQATKVSTVLRDGLAHGVIVGTSMWTKRTRTPPSCCMFKSCWRWQGYLFICVFCVSSLLCCTSTRRHGRVSDCRFSSYFFFSGLQALDILWYKINHCTLLFSPLELLRAPIEYCFIAVYLV